MLYQVYLQFINDKQGFINQLGGSRTERTASGRQWDIFDRARRQGNTSIGNTGNGYTPPPNNNTSGGSGFFGTAFNGIDNVVKGMASITDKFYRTQFGQQKDIGGPDSNVGQKILDLIEKGGLNPLSLLKGGFTKIEEEILDQLTRESQLKSEINSKTTLTLQLSKDLREDILESAVNAAKFGFTINQLGELYTGLAEKSGRYALINQETMDLAAPVAATLSMNMEQLSETINEFEKVGKGANDTLETIFEVEKKSMVLGLNGKKMVADLQTNIGKLNEYGFKKGIDGLAEMTRKATEFRMSIQEAFTIADKVMNPEGALELTANLQVLGGAIGDFNDPLKLMYMATNNVEGLQDALIDASKSLATYNQEQGRFEITGVNLRRAKEMATQLGVSYQELAKGSIAAAERSSAATSLMMSGLQMKDEDKELLLNLSRMEKGEMVIKIPKTMAQEFEGRTEVKLDQMTEGLKQKLIANAEAIKEMTPENMAMAQLTETQKMAGYLEYIAAYYKRRGTQAFRGVLQGTGIQGGLKDQYNKITGYANEIKNTPTDVNFQQKVNLQTQNTKERYWDEPGRDLNKMWNDLSWNNLWNGKTWNDVLDVFKNNTSDEQSKRILEQLEALNRKDKNAKITIQNIPNNPNPKEYLAPVNHD